MKSLDANILASTDNPSRPTIGNRENIYGYAIVEVDY